MYNLYKVKCYIFNWQNVCSLHNSLFQHCSNSVVFFVFILLHFNHSRFKVFHLNFEIFRTIASFIKISWGHSLIIKLIFIKFFRVSSLCFEGLGLWCLTTLSTIFQLYHGRWNRSTQRKPPTCRKSLTKLLSHNITSSTPRLSGIQTQWW